MVEFCGGEELYPFSRIIGAKDVKIRFKFLIGLLSLSISLRMISSGEVNIIFEEASEFPGEGGCYNRRGPYIIFSIFSH